MRIQRIAKEEHRTISELLREAFRQYLATRDLGVIRKKGRKVAKKMKLTPDDITKAVTLNAKELGLKRSRVRKAVNKARRQK